MQSTYAMDDFLQRPVPQLLDRCRTTSRCSSAAKRVPFTLEEMRARAFQLVFACANFSLNRTTRHSLCAALFSKLAKNKQCTPLINKARGSALLQGGALLTFFTNLLNHAIAHFFANLPNNAVHNEYLANTKDRPTSESLGKIFPKSNPRCKIVIVLVFGYLSQSMCHSLLRCIRI